MLKHEQPKEQSQEQQAAQVRVSPEELAAAVARLEARRAGADGKIAIGDAVSELSLDATAEEVLAEVRAGQTQAVTQGQAVQTQRQSGQQRRRVACVAAAAVAISSVGLFCMRAAAPRVSVASISPAVNLSPQHILLNPNLPVGEPDGKLVLLSEVGDNQPVHCSYSSGSFQQYSSGQGTQWTLIKHKGKTYVRGWILKMSPAVIAQDGIDVSAIGDPQFAVPLTLAVDGFEVSDPGDSTTQFHAARVQLDQHASEKWNP